MTYRDDVVGCDVSAGLELDLGLDEGGQEGVEGGAGSHALRLVLLGAHAGAALLAAQRHHRLERRRRVRYVGG